MDLEFFESVLRRFFIQRLKLCNFTFIGKEESLMERLEILPIGVQSIFEPSLRNLPTILPTPVALLVLNSFNIFRIDTELTFLKLKFF